jgi:hypothetical protein
VNEDTPTCVNYSEYERCKELEKLKHVGCGPHRYEENGVCIVEEWRGGWVWVMDGLVVGGLVVMGELVAHEMARWQRERMLVMCSLVMMKGLSR